ncbi:hypothetical protein IW146_006361 [Coemansia sp. RSA 922]|nr:hypothetical protein H4S03_002952 [Coemansia sp. S3946]KAJ2072152.1 hypothetical protein GGH13_002880 [Coemansia sp. S155-1]KAJ2104561.1 hypothetical protein GGI09_000064 [Coemansia sp. S100]KAJ2109454.1 hypothetical protein IW146_006361 [Coemansia sp. RSA 922]
MLFPSTATAALARRIALSSHRNSALKTSRLARSCYTTDSVEKSVRYLQQLQARYDLARDLCLKDPVRPTSAKARQHFQPTAQDIFANTEVQLSKVRTYGLDLDYTLASYTEKLPETIYTMIRDVLVNSMLYPPGLKALKYDSSFAIRGISYDRETGWLFKLDSNYNIAMDTIHYGREPLRDLEDVFALHGGPHLAPDYVKNHLYQLNDMYSVPEATLLADIIQYFSENDISFHPRYLAEDIRAAGEYIHRGDGISASPLHATIMNNIGDYLNRAPELLHILESLKREGKRLFLLTNSGYKYVDTVLSYMFNTSNWRDVFDVAIVSARKPGWYLSHRPFRLVPTQLGAKTASVQPWELVDRFEDGQVYSGGNLASFTSITGYADRSVLYIGDHVYSDLRDPSIQKGWFTGAIVSELKHELSVGQSPEYLRYVRYIQLIEKTLKLSQQETRSPSFMQLAANDKETFRLMLEAGRMERRRTRWKLRDLYNPHFGSVFRTSKDASLFSTKVQAYSNLYTADLANLGAYPSDYIFYPKRKTQAHECQIPEVDDLLDQILKL